MNRQAELDMCRRRLRMAEADQPRESETVLHGEGRASRLIGTELERLRLRQFLNQFRGTLYRKQTANDSQISPPIP